MRFKLSAYLDMFSDSYFRRATLGDSLGEECRRLGFNMDAGESFINQCSKGACYNADVLERIINDVDSIELLGNGIFS